MTNSSGLKEVRTLNGQFDARCRQCLMAVYRGWIDSRPPPVGCCEGHDDDISKCGSVYNALVSIVIGQDYIKRDLIPREEFLLVALGPKADALMADIRAKKQPPGHKPKEPNYDQPRPLQ